MTDLFAEFNKLMVRAAREKISDADITRVASMNARYLHRIRAGQVPVSRLVLSRISNAMARIRKGDKDPTGAKAAASYRLAICLVAREAGVTPTFILSADPAKRATADPDWLRAARLRWIALYIAVIYLQIPQAEVARAAGMSRANVCRSLQDLEDKRGEPEISGILATVEEAFQG